MKHGSLPFTWPIARNIQRDKKSDFLTREVSGIERGCSQRGNLWCPCIMTLEQRWQVWWQSKGEGSGGGSIMISSKTWSLRVGVHEATINGTKDSRSEADDGWQEWWFHFSTGWVFWCTQDTEVEMPSRQWESEICRWVRKENLAGVIHGSVLLFRSMVWAPTLFQAQSLCLASGVPLRIRSHGSITRKGPHTALSLTGA